MADDQVTLPVDSPRQQNIVDKIRFNEDDNKDHEHEPLVADDVTLNSDQTNENNNNNKTNESLSRPKFTEPAPSIRIIGTAADVTKHNKNSTTSPTSPKTPQSPPKLRSQVSVLGLGDYNPVENGVSLTWKNINYTVGDKVILEKQSGYVGPGNVCCVMGPSGSGKTSLLSILSGNRSHTSGEIHYQGRIKKMTTRSEDIMGFNGNASYVAQDDTLIGMLTVEETLYYAAQLKVSDKKVDKKQQVDAIIKYLGLESCRNTRVGTVFAKGISGGQKRRLSIGIELVTQPALLFLDEVTSGLDATSAYQLLRLITKLANLGHSIVMTIHQPTSRLFKLMCDNNFYMLILESGHQSYFGYAKHAVEYFNSLGYPVPPLSNATDFFLDLVDRDFQHELNHSTLESNNNLQRIDNINSSNNNMENENEQITIAATNSSGTGVIAADVINTAFDQNYLPAILQEIDDINKERKGMELTHLHGNNFFIQFWILFKRNFLNNARNPMIFTIRLVMYGMLCLCLGTLYLEIGNSVDDTQDRISILFFVGAFLTFMSISAMPAFVEERAIYIRERGNNHYGTLAYVVSNFISGLPWLFLISLVCTGLIYGMIQSRLGFEYFLIYLLTLFIGLMVAETMMVAISALTPYFIVGIAMGAGLLGLYMIVCGFFMLPKNIPPGWIWVHHGISFHTYTFQMFMYNEFHDNNNVDKGINGTGDGNEILKRYDMDDVDYAFNFGICIIMAAFYKILFYVLLKLLHRRQK